MTDDAPVVRTSRTGDLSDYIDVVQAAKANARKPGSPSVSFLVPWDGHKTVVSCLRRAGDLEPAHADGTRLGLHIQVIEHGSALDGGTVPAGQVKIKVAPKQRRAYNPRPPLSDAEKADRAERRAAKKLERAGEMAREQEVEKAAPPAAKKGLKV